MVGKTIREFTSTLAPMKAIIDRMAGALDTREITQEELMEAPDPQRSVLAMQRNYRLFMAAWENVPADMREEWLALALVTLCGPARASLTLRDTLALVEIANK